MPTFAATLRIEKFIDEPYWPEMAHLIDIQKESGLNRARSAANRRKALEGYLKEIGMSLDDYTALEAAARRPFHVADDGTIFIPAEKFAAFLVAATDQARAAQRPCAVEQVRTLIRVSDLATAKTGADGVWERFSVVSGGAGNKLSNQRGLRRSHYIVDFDATGTVAVDSEYVRPEVLRNLIVWGGRYVGIGASRKMGWGRFALAEWRVASDDGTITTAAE